MNFLFGVAAGIIVGILADRGYLKKIGQEAWSAFEDAVKKRKALAAANKK